MISLQNANLLKVHLEGVYSDREQYHNFIDRITGQINKESDITGISKRTLTKKEKERLIAQLTDIYNYKRYKERYSYIKYAIIRIKDSNSSKAVNFYKAILGKYTEKEAKKWIKEYKKAIKR